MSPAFCAGPARATRGPERAPVPQQPWALLHLSPKRLTGSQNPHPSHPAAPHRRNKRKGGDIIQSRAEKRLNLISVGHGHNRISLVLLEYHFHVSTRMDNCARKSQPLVLSGKMCHGGGRGPGAGLAVPSRAGLCCCAHSAWHGVTKADKGLGESPRLCQR